MSMYIEVSASILASAYSHNDPFKCTHFVVLKLYYGVDVTIRVTNDEHYFDFKKIVQYELRVHLFEIPQQGLSKPNGIANNHFFSI